MGETSQQIEESLRAERASLDHNLRELEGRARQAVDWREHYRKHPGVAVGLAFGAGMLMGLMTVGADEDAGDDRGGDQRAARTSTIVTPTPHAAERGDSRLASLSRSLKQSDAVARAQHQARDVVERIAESLLALASTKIVGYIGDSIPGFADEFNRRSPSTR